MDPSTQTAVIVNPPLLLSGTFIDNPAFAFRPALSLAAALRKSLPGIHYVDAFQDGTIAKQDGRFVLGTPPAELANRIAELHPSIAVIHYSSFLRAEGLFNPLLDELLRTLQSRRIRVMLADMYDFSTHYIAYDESALHALYPAVELASPKQFPYEQLGCDPPRTFPRFPVAQAPEYARWLDAAAAHNLIKDHTSRETVFPYLSSWGCPHNCIFCQEKGELWQGIPADEVIRDLNGLQQCGIARVHFVDPCVNHDPDRFRAILRHCRSHNLGVHFCNGIGLRGLDPETADLLSATVAGQVYISPEALSDAALVTLRKPFRAEDARAAIDTLNAVGVVPRAHFILNIPGQEHRASNEMLAGICRLAAAHKIEPHVQNFVPRADLFVRDARAASLYQRFLPECAPDRWTRIAYRSFLQKLHDAGEEKLIINLSYRCNNRCVFCAVGDRPREDGDFDRQIRAMAEARAAGVQLLDLDGGEPLLYPRLFDLLEAARTFQTVTITTNGRLLAEPALTCRLAGYANLRLLISLHGAQDAVHDRLTGVPGSFAETLAGIRNAVRQFGSVGINTTVTSVNQASLTDTATLALALGARSFNIQWYAPFGQVDSSLRPSKEVVEWVREVVQRFGGRLEINLVNLQYCRAPDLYDRMAAEFGKANRRMLFVDGNMVNLSAYLASRRVRDETCEACECSLVCRGHWVFSAIRQPNTARSAHSQSARAVRLLDIVPGYACNRACIFCTATDEMRTVNLNTDDLLAKIRKALIGCLPSCARIGGGEPTIRNDLPRILRYLRDREIHDVRIQTNGLRFFYPEYLDQLTQSGLTGVNFSIPGYDEDSMAYLTRVPGTYRLIADALSGTLKRGLHVEIDILLSKPVLPRLVPLTEHYRSLGITRINFWYIALEGKAKERVAELVPTMSAAAGQVATVIDRFPAMHIRSFYLPYCLLPRHIENVWQPADEAAYVITPASSFFLDEGQIDQGTKLPCCAGCRFRTSCAGVRPAYLQRFGDAELRAC